MLNGLLLDGGLQLDVSKTARAVTLTAAGATNLDSDGDGLTDAYELAHGLDPRNANDANKDGDSDGHTNLQEFLAGTDPDKPNSVLRVDKPAITKDGFSISFFGVSNRTYRMERSDDLRTWTTIKTFIGNNTIINVTDALPSTAANSYYRIVVSR